MTSLRRRIFDRRPAVIARTPPGEPPANPSLGSPAVVSMLEMLEGRQFMSSVVLTGGVLFAQGDPQTANTITFSPGANQTVVATVNGQQTSFPLSGITMFRIHGGDAADTLTVANLSIPAFVHGFAGNDTVRGGGGSDTI